MRRYSREVPDFNQIWVCEQIFIVVPNMKFHPKPSSGCRSDTCGQTDGRTVFATTRTRLQTLYLVRQPIFLTSVTASNKHIMSLDEERERERCVCFVLSLSYVPSVLYERMRLELWPGGGGKGSIWIISCPIAILSTSNPTWNSLGSIPDLRSDRSRRRRAKRVAIAVCSVLLSK